MCLIAYKPNDKATFTYEDFKIAVENNKDGTGIMYPKDGRIVARKYGKPTEKQNKKMYQEFISQPAAALHVRIATAGGVSDTNAHPFEILNKEKHGVDLWMMHNGHVKCERHYNERSDTWHFVNMYLRPMLKRDAYAICSPFLQEMVKDYIGCSRLLFMYGDGTTVIVADGVAKYDEGRGGLWLSNGHSLNKKYTPPANNYYQHPNYHNSKPYGADEYDDDFPYSNEYSRFIGKDGKQTTILRPDTKLVDIKKPAMITLPSNDPMDDGDQDFIPARELTRKDVDEAVAEVMDEVDNSKDMVQTYADLFAKGKEEGKAITGLPMVIKQTDKFDKCSTLAELIEAIADLTENQIIELVNDEPSLITDIMCDIKDKYNKCNWGE